MKERVLALSKDRTLMCPRCKSNQMEYQTVTEPRRPGCLITVLMVLISLTGVGLIISIPWLLCRKKNWTTTYAVCKKCGHRIVTKRTKC